MSCNAWPISSSMKAAANASPANSAPNGQLEILLREQPLPGDATRLEDIGWTMTESSLCGLGQTASSALLSAMERWPALFTAEGE